MNIEILNRVRDANGDFVPLDRLGTTIETARDDIAELEAFGFGFEWHPYFGVAYRSPARRLCPDQIEFELGTKIIGRRIAVWNRVASTNDLAASASSSKANEGLVILAEEQSAGRGQRGRRWSAPEGSCVLMSLLIFPPEELSEPFWLTALAALAVADVVSESTGRRARIKWPNDVRVDGKKAAGILVERGQGAVIGIGLNVNLTETDFPEELRETATSLKILGAETRACDRSEIVRALVRNLDRRYVESLERGRKGLTDDWRNASEHLGRRVRITTLHGSVEGAVKDLELHRGVTIESDRGEAIFVELQKILGLEALSAVE